MNSSRSWSDLEAIPIDTSKIKKITPSWKYTIFGVIELIVQLGLLFLLFDNSDKLSKDKCLSSDGKTDLCYCEAISSGLIKQPYNTWSALVMAVAGLWVLYTLAFPIQPINRMTSNVFFPAAYGFLAVYLGPGSMAFHGSFTYIGGFLDTFSMYVWLGFILVYNILRVTNMPLWGFATLYLALETVLGVIRYTVTNGVDNIFVVLVIVTVLSEVVVFFRTWKRWNWEAYGWLFGGIATFLFALLIWKLSQTGGPFCYPDYWIQGHAIWHTLSGVVAACLYQYLRTTIDP